MTGALRMTAAVVVPAARVMVQDGQLDEPTAREVMRRLVSPEFRRWRRQVRGAGFCHRPVRVNIQAILFREFHHSLPHCLEIHPGSLRDFHAQANILCDRQGGDKLELLMNHANP